MISPVAAAHTVPGRSHRTACRPVRSIASRPQPWNVISRRHEGLLRYARARGIVSLAVRYAAWGRRLLLRLPLYNDAANFLDRADLALDVHTGEVGLAGIARAAGVGLAVPARSVPAEIDAMLAPWPEDLPTRAVVIVPERVTWLPVTDDVRYPPLPERPDRLPGTFADIDNSGVWA